MQIVHRLRLLLILAVLPTHAAAELSDDFAARLTMPLPEAGPAPIGAGNSTRMDLEQSYVVIAQPVQIFLEHVAQEAGVRLTLSDKVKGVVRNLRITATTAQILDAVADQKGLEWFDFNGVVYVSARNEATTRLVSLGNVTPQQAKAALEEAGLPPSSFETRATSAGTVLALSGPPALLAIAEALIEGIPATAVVGPRNERAPMVLVRRGNDESWVTLRQSSVPTYADQ